MTRKSKVYLPTEAKYQIKNEYRIGWATIQELANKHKVSCSYIYRIIQDQSLTPLPEQEPFIFSEPKSVSQPVVNQSLVEQVKVEPVKTNEACIRPWGSYTVLEERGAYKIKRIEVQPGRRLSLQKHHHRAESWVVVSGTALITKGEEEQLLRINESVYIPSCTIHRLANPGIIPLIMIEVQTGEFLGEIDIVRYEDDFNRATDADVLGTMPQK